MQVKLWGMKIIQLIQLDNALIFWPNKYLISESSENYISIKINNFFSL